MSIYTSEKVSPYVYICTHKITYEFYIGYREKNVSLHRPSDIDIPLYKTSSMYVNPIFEEFNWYIVAEFIDGSPAYDFEQILIQENWKNPLLLNGQYHTGKTTQFRNNGHSEETKQKMRKPKPPRTEEHRRHMSEAKKGTKLIFTEEHKANLSAAALNRTTEHAAKISAANTGKTRSVETKAKISISKQNPSEETRKKMSEAKLNQKIVECPHCSKIGKIGPMKHWHFDNCKLILI